MLRKLTTSLAVAASLSLVLATGASAAVNASGSVEQVYVTDATPDAAVTLLNSSDQAIRTGTVNDFGGALFREVAAGSGYKVQIGAETSAPLTVLDKDDDAPPDPNAVYNQTLPRDGYGYMRMRDGVKLAYSVHPPSDALGVLAGAGIPIPPELLNLFAVPPAGPVETPTLIEYSGYATARPSGPESGISLLANIMGYTVVDVNMRGTGCSGGAYDFFEPLQSLDGYDVIETVARQSWVKGDKVGMFGISFGGISQLFTAQRQPPSLSAVSPISLIDQTQTTLYPGGILNTGFAYSWALDRIDDAKPAGPNPGEGQPYAWERIQDYDNPVDPECAANQALHPEAVNLDEKIRANDNYIPEVADPLSPKTFVNKINVPTFMACQWTDEQTGGNCPTMASRLTGTNKKWVTFTNGTHVDSLAPETLTRLYNFLQIYVDEAAPAPKAGLVNAAAPVVYEEGFGITGVTPRPDPIMLNPDYNSAKTAWEAQKPIRIAYDNGAGGSTPGHPYPAFSRDYDSFPAPGTTGRSWYLNDGGTLTDAPPAQTAADGYAYNGANAAATNFTGDSGAGTDGLWTDTPPYTWAQDPAGSAVAYATGPLAADTTVLGSGAVDAWVRSSKPNVDLEVTISEIRPDGKETFVQGGWMRGDARVLDPAKSTELEPVLSLRESDAQPLPANQFVKATIPLYYQGHVYRAGSRIRVRVSAPGGDQPIWSFAESPNIQADVAIARGPGMPSRLLLPVTADGDAPEDLPPCPSLRGQPCRDYVPFANASAPLTISDAQPGAPKNKTCAAKKKAKKKAGKKKDAGKKLAKKKRKKKRACGKKKKRKKSKRR